MNEKGFDCMKASIAFGLLQFIVLIISDFDIRVVPRFSSSFSSFGRNQIEVIRIQALTAFAFQMISDAKVRFLSDNQ